MNDDALTLAEQSVLGACMLSATTATEVLRMLTPEDFHYPKHGVIFKAILRLHADEAPTDVVTVVDDLIRAGDMARAGNAEYVHQLTSMVPTASSGGYYAGIVHQASVGRAITEAAVGMQDQVIRGEQPAAVLASSITRLTGIRDRASTSRAARTLREVLAVPADVDQYDWVIPGLLERRDRCIITGSEGGGKSTFLRQLAILSAAGLHPFSDQQVKPARVLVIDAENSERQWRREVRGLAQIAGQFGVRDPREGLAVDFNARLNVTRAADLGNVHRMIDAWSPDLVLIGPLYRIAPSMKNDEEALPVLEALETIRDRGVAILIEAHAPHADGKSGVRDLRPIGASALLRWPEFGMGIAKPAKVGEPFSLVRWRGDRDGRFWPPYLTSKKDSAYAHQRWPWEPTSAYWASPQGAATLV